MYSQSFYSLIEFSNTSVRTSTICLGNQRGQLSKLIIIIIHYTGFHQSRLNFFVQCNSLNLDVFILKLSYIQATYFCVGES